MTTPFGPQLIGETEKTLNALLVRRLDGTLTEPQWVTLRIATMLDGSADHEGLVAVVADRAHFGDAAAQVDELTARGLLDDGHISASGLELLTHVQASLADDISSLFDDLASDDVAATERVLNELLGRARTVLGNA
jgi:hypothetical protein